MNIKTGKRGTTLTELLIATFIFGFLTMILLGIINFGTHSWRKLESRSTAEKEVRRALLDLSGSLRNTDIRTFNSGSTTVSGAGVTKWMCFKTAINEQIYDIEWSGYDGAEPMPDKRIKWTYYVLYYCIKPPSDGCTDDTATNYYCPHKWLVKKYLAFNGVTYSTGFTASDSAIKSDTAYLDQAAISKYLTRTDSISSSNFSSGTEKAVDNTNSRSITVVARNMLVFTSNFYNPYGGANAGDASIACPEVQFTIKCFKVLEYGSSGAIGTSNLDALSNAKTAVQVDQKIVPANNNYENK